MGKIKFSSQPGAELDEELLRSMWRLRLSFKELKSNFDAEADYARFAAFCRSCKSIFLCRDEAGIMRGFYVIKVARDSLLGREYLRITPEYAYIEKEYRGSPAMRLAYLRLLPVLFTNFGVPVYGTATITPSSYLLYTDAFRVFTHGDEDVPAWERSLLDSIGREFGGEDWDDEDKLIRSRTRLRDERPPRRFRSDRHRRDYEHYVELNPTWQDGNQLVCVFPISVKVVWPTLVGAVSRALKRSRPVPATSPDSQPEPALADVVLPVPAGPAAVTLPQAREGEGATPAAITLPAQASTEAPNRSPS